jgi:hypothetical protein
MVLRYEGRCLTIFTCSLSLNLDALVNNLSDKDILKYLLHV